MLSLFSTKKPEVKSVSHRSPQKGPKKVYKKQVNRRSTTKKFSKNPKIPKQVSSKFHDALRLLVSKRGTCREHKREVGSSERVSPLVFEANDVSTASAFVSLNQVYRFRLGGHTTISQTTGVVNSFFACDPSAAGINFPEWSTLSALFSEFRLVSFSVQFVHNNFAGTAFGTSTAFGPAMIAGNLGTAIAPGSYANLADNADAKLWSPRETANTGYTHHLLGTGVNWSEVTTPTVAPYAGAPGSIQIYSNFGSTSQSDVIHCLISGIYDFRSRV